MLEPVQPGQLITAEQYNELVAAVTRQQAGRHGIVDSTGAYFEGGGGGGGVVSIVNLAIIESGPTQLPSGDWQYSAKLVGANGSGVGDAFDVLAIVFPFTAPQATWYRPPQVGNRLPIIQRPHWLGSPTNQLLESAWVLLDRIFGSEPCPNA